MVSHINVQKTNEIFTFGFPDMPRMQKLDPGMYNLYADIRSSGFQKITVKTDKLISLKKSVAAEVFADIEMFLTDKVKQNYKDYEMLYRRGVLLYGPPGTGKTSAIVEIARNFVEKKGGIVLFNPNPHTVSSYIKNYREIEKDREFLIVFEELEDLIDNGHETDILSLLDGERSIDNAIFLATTNYIKRIPPRIRKRPSRFARCIRIGTPDAGVRKAFLEQRILPRHLTEVDIDKLVGMTNGFTIDHLKDLIVTMFCFGQPMNTAVNNIKAMIATDNEDDEE